ncbi:MAG: acyltransferase domain-containing protein [Janthinobacterium lividum]
MIRATVLMFAGQGTQYYQMGRALHEQDPAYRAAMDRCDDACGPVSGQAVSRLILDRPMADTPHFNRQSEVTLALLAVGYSLAQALFARGLRPDLLLGSSFGETIASVVAGTLTLERGFALVRAQGEVIEATAPPGAMLAVLGAHDALRHLPEMAAAELAAVNSPRHFVLALPPADVAPLEAALARHQVACARLPVQYGFHASLIDACGPGLRALAAAYPRSAPTIPIVSCMSTGLYDHTDPGHFWQVSRRPIRFADTVKRLAADRPCRFVEAGPTGSLATFVKQVLGPQAVAQAAINQFGNNLRTLAEILP